MNNSIATELHLDELHLNSQGWLVSKQVRHVKSPNYNLRPCEVDLLVIHCISLPEGEYGNGYINKFFCNQLDCSLHPSFADIEQAQVSSHFMIERTGEIIQYISTDHRAWHCGISSWDNRTNCNDFSIGIELEGVDTSSFTNQQYRSLIYLTRAILRHYPTISHEQIVGHSDIAPTRKTDPGTGFDWSYYKQSL